MMPRPKRDLTRITINLPTNLLQKIDEYALELGIPRSTAIMILCSERLSFFSDLDCVGHSLQK